MDSGSLWARLRGFLEPENAGGVAALMGASMVPGVGEALDVADIAAGIQDRDPVRVGIGALAAALPFVSSVGIRGLLKSPKKIRAYHGSPHDFDKFDISKLSTGEGHQAYGTGLYFAENKRVGEEYKRVLGGPDKYKYNDIEMPEPFNAYINLGYDPTDAVYAAREDLRRSIDDNLKQIKYLQSDLKDTVESEKVLGKSSYKNQLMKHIDNRIYMHYKLEKQLSELKGVKKINMDDLHVIPGPGKLYTVDINADPDTFFDLDKRIGQQSPHIRDVFRRDTWMSNKRPMRTYFAHGDRYGNMSRGIPWLFRNAYAKTGNGKEIADAMREHGVSGFRYLDQFSRQGKDPMMTRNYVVFDPDIIDIVDKRKSGGIVR